MISCNLNPVFLFTLVVWNNIIEFYIKGPSISLGRVNAGHIVTTTFFSQLVPRQVSDGVLES